MLPIKRGTAKRLGLDKPEPPVLTEVEQHLVDMTNSFMEGLRRDWIPVAAALSKAFHTR